MSRKSPTIAAAALLIGAATFLSRILGLIREQLFAALFGASWVADAFIVAFRIPNLLRDLFAEGVFAQAFVPSFKKELVQNGRPAAYVFANRIIGTLLIVIGAILILGYFAAPYLVDALASQYQSVPGKFPLTVLLTRVLLPFLLMVSLAAVCMGMLNAQDRYGPPALAPALFNVISIGGALLLLGLGLSDRDAAIGWAIAAVVGGFGQLLIQVFPLWKLDFRPKPKPDPLFKTKATRSVVKLMAPAIVGLAAMQINLFVNTTFASQQEGAVSWLNYAFRFLQLPIGIFGVAIATVVTTKVADSVAKNDQAKTVEHVATSLRLALLLTVPATTGLVILSEPIIQLVYEHGVFSFDSTVRTAAALRYYMIGLVAYAGVKVMAPLFYANDRVRLPMLASVISVAINIAINVGLFRYYGFRVLAFGTAIGAVINFALLYYFASTRLIKLPHRELAWFLARTVAAAGIMGATCWGLHDRALAWWGAETLLARAANALIPVTVGAVVFFACAKLMKLREAEAILAKVTRRLRRR